MSHHKDEAKQLLRYYFTYRERHPEQRIAGDCLLEIDSIVDHIVAAAADELEKRNKQ